MATWPLFELAPIRQTAWPPVRAPVELGKPRRTQQGPRVPSTAIRPHALQVLSTAIRRWRNSRSSSNRCNALPLAARFPGRQHTGPARRAAAQLPRIAAHAGGGVPAAILLAVRGMAGKMRTDSELADVGTSNRMNASFGNALPRGSRLRMTRPYNDTKSYGECNHRLGGLGMSCACWPAEAAPAPPPGLTCMSAPRMASRGTLPTWIVS